MKILTAIVACLLTVLFSQLAVKSYARESNNRYLPRLAYTGKVSLSYYPVEGKTTEQLRNSMFERGPIGYGQKRYFAYTYWQMKVRPNKTSETQPLRKQVQCRFSVLLPFLWKEPGQSTELVGKWGRFLKGVVDHESRHVRLAMRGCRSMKRTNNGGERLTAISKRMKLRDQEYDLKTKHGILHGVSLV